MAQESFARSIVSCGIESATSLWEQLKYCINLNQNEQALRIALEDLCGREGDVNDEIEKAEVLQGKKRRREITVWQENVKRIKQEVGELLFIQGGFFSRLQLGKLVKKKIKKVVELQEKGNFFNGMTIEPLSRGQMLPTTKTLVGATAKRILEEVLKWLKDANVGMIGVWGMGGIGKTTIMKYINNDLIENNAFKYIIWVTVSKALDLKTLQNDIARSIGTTLCEDEYEENRAAQLNSNLARRKNFVLILDGLWEAFPLEKIGIPTFNQDNGSKMVITTRSLDVCGDMGTDKDIAVELLSGEEAWELFKTNVGDIVLSSFDIQVVAKLVVKECGRLPLAIVIVGRAMSKVDDVKVWRNALKELQSSSLDIRNMDCHVFKPLKFSYDRLRNENIQTCFLYCALFRGEIYVSELTEYWVCEGIICDEGDKEMNENKVHTILTELKHACMLEETGYSSKTKMHDVLRDMAIDITKTKPRFLVKVGVGLAKVPKEDEWTENTERISLIGNNIEVLSGQPKCPKLTTLFLQENHWLRSISNSFFEHVHDLRVVDLSQTNIEMLPESLSDLVKLRALILNRCGNLKKLPSLAKLKELMVLKLEGSGIEELPEGMEMLINLRLLQLTHTFNLQIFPAGVIPKLVLLEHLLLFGSPCIWKERGGGNRIEEIISSTQLATLTFSLDVDTFSKYVESEHWEKLKYFDLTIGDLPSHYRFFGLIPYTYRVTIFDLDLADNQIPLVLPDNTRELRMGIFDLEHATNVWESLYLPNLRDLNRCFITNDGMECFLRTTKGTLPKLKYLHLQKLHNLRALWDGVMPQETFSNLISLNVNNCHKLKILFSWRMIHHLINLEGISVYRCNKMETVIGGQEERGEEGSKIGTVTTLPKLQRIFLECLPNLKSVCNKVLVCHSLETFNVFHCSKLKKLPFSGDHLPSALQEFEGTKEWFDSLEWDDPITKTSLQPLFKHYWHGVNEVEEENDESHADHDDDFQLN